VFVTLHIRLVIHTAHSHRTPDHSSQSSCYESQQTENKATVHHQTKKHKI